MNVIQIKALWFMAFWQVANFVFLFCVAYFKFIPSVWIIMAIVLYEGLLGGAVYVNGFYLASEEIPADKKEFGMSSISVWYSIAILLAGVAALFLAPWIGPPIPLEPLVNATNETGIFWFDM